MRYIKYLEVENFKSFGDRKRFHFGNFEDLKFIFEHHLTAGNSDVMDAMSFVLGSDPTKTNRLSDLINENAKSVTARVTLCAGATTDDDEDDDGGGREMQFTRKISNNFRGSYQIDEKVVMKKDYFEQLRVVGMNAADKYCLMLEGAAVLFSMKSRQQQTHIFQVMSEASSSKQEEKCKINEQETKLIDDERCKYYLLKMYHLEKCKLELEKCVEESSRAISQHNQNHMRKYNELRVKKTALEIVQQTFQTKEVIVKNKKANLEQTRAALKIQKAEFNSAKERFARAKYDYSNQEATIDQLNRAIREREEQLSRVENDNTTLEYENLKKQSEATLGEFFQQLRDLRKDKSSLQMLRDSAKSLVEDAESQLTQQTPVGRKRKRSEVEPSTNKKADKKKEKSAVEVESDDEKSLKQCITSYEYTIEKNKELLKNAQNKLDKINIKISRVEKYMNGIKEKMFADFCRSQRVKNIGKYEINIFLRNKKNAVKKIKLDYEIERMKRQIGYEKNDTFELEKMNVAEDNLELCKMNLLAVINKEKEQLEQLNESLVAFQVAKKRRKAIKSEIADLKCELHKHKIRVFDFGERRALAQLDIEEVREMRHQLFVKCREKSVKFCFKNGNWSDVNYYTNTLDGDYSEEDRIILDYSSLRSNLKQLPSRDILLKGSSFKQFEDVSKPKKKDRLKSLKMERVKSQRLRGFITVFQHVNRHVDKIYKELTKCRRASATLSLENSEQPYLDGIKYEFVPPPGKGIKKQMNEMEIEERYVASMALLVAIQTYKNAAEEAEEDDEFTGNRDLERANVRKLAQLIQKRNAEKTWSIS